MELMPQEDYSCQSLLNGIAVLFKNILGLCHTLPINVSIKITFVNRFGFGFFFFFFQFLGFCSFEVALVLCGVFLGGKGGFNFLIYLSVIKTSVKIVYNNF